MGKHGVPSGAMSEEGEQYLWFLETTTTQLLLEIGNTTYKYNTMCMYVLLC